MSEKVFDWKGNEVKEGMTIYFVQTKPNKWGKIGVLIPAGCNEDGRVTEIWESDEAYEERINKDIWELGQPYEVVKRKDGGFNIVLESEGYTLATPIEWSISEKTTIAIKGISDKQEVDS